jgi:signal transduction histidine kinase
MAIEYTASAISDSEESTVVVVTFRDITARVAVERMKDEFVSTVSHELRTPLTSIRGSLGLLNTGLLGDLSERGARMLEIAVANTDRLVRLINDILDIERMEAGRMELNRTTVAAHDLIAQAIETMQPMAEREGVRLVVSDAAAATLWADSDRMMQMLTNLLSNAIKFSPRGTSVTIGGKVDERSFVFSVADQGRGIPEDKLEMIFERFRQVNATDSRDKGGSGLGLAICRSIVNAHGGRIWAERVDPTGARFQFTIPILPMALAS